MGQKKKSSLFNLVFPNYLFLSSTHTTTYPTLRNGDLMAFFLSLWSLRNKKYLLKTWNPFSKQVQDPLAILVLDMLYVMPHICRSMHVCAHTQSPTWEKRNNHMIDVLLFSSFCTSKKIRFLRRSLFPLRHCVSAKTDLASGLWNSQSSGPCPNITLILSLAWPSTVSPLWEALSLSFPTPAG